MNIEYASDKVRSQCTSIKASKKLFGGDAVLSRYLLARVNALKNAGTVKDIIVQPGFRFHSLKNKGRRNLNGYFSIDVKSVKESWRIIFQPLNDAGQPYANSGLQRPPLRS